MIFLFSFSTSWCIFDGRDETGKNYTSMKITARSMLQRQRFELGPNCEQLFWINQTAQGFSVLYVRTGLWSISCLACNLRINLHHGIAEAKIYNLQIIEKRTWKVVEKSANRIYQIRHIHFKMKIYLRISTSIHTTSMLPYML